MMKLTPGQHAFWTRFRAATGCDADGPRFVDAFGDNPDMQDDLAALVMAGDKRASASLDRWYDDETRPRPGDLALILDGAGEPVCVIRTLRVDICRVSEVTADFALAEGEGDKTLAWWLDAHRAFWRREADRHGFDYSDDLAVVCERFERVWAPD
ncbi:MAG: ASCH domain-containing protein [Alphaproteobacteria bacterium]|nr:ASCH domain-containing protein [Alphaproteobacteria bacterium]